MASILSRTAVARRRFVERQVCPCLVGGIICSSTRQTHHVHQASASVSLPQRYNFSAAAMPTSSPALSAIENTPLDSPEGTALLKGLEINTVHSEDDDHPLAVYTIKDEAEDEAECPQRDRIPVLLLHGRTWSSLPVYHLTKCESNNRSLIQALYDNNNIQPYSLDFRGFGGTPKDASGFVEPLKCVSDAVSVLNWIHDKHSNKPALLGWSHGALIAQITAQRHSDALSKLILYGSIYNPAVKYSIPPPGNPHSGQTDHEDFPLHELASQNELDGAMEDFTSVSNEARIFPPKSAKLFAETALVSDPIKVQWWNLHQLNECRPSSVKVPTLVIAGDQDPYAPLQTQTELFVNLGRGVDKTWSIIANSDHAVHLSDERQRFVENVSNFLGCATTVEDTEKV